MTTLAQFGFVKRWFNTHTHQARGDVTITPQFIKIESNANGEGS